MDQVPEQGWLFETAGGAAVGEGRTPRGCVPGVRPGRVPVRRGPVRDYRDLWVYRLATDLAGEVHDLLSRAGHGGGAADGSPSEESRALASRLGACAREVLSRIVEGWSLRNDRGACAWHLDESAAAARQVAMWLSYASGRRLLPGGSGAEISRRAEALAHGLVSLRRVLASPSRGPLRAAG